MGKTYLIDTNTLLDYMAGSLPDKAQAFVEDILDVDFNVSVINRIEARIGHSGFDGFYEFGNDASANP